MRHAFLVEKETKRRIPLSGKTTVGRAEDNAVVIPERHCSRHHCVISRSLFGAWNLKQLAKKEEAGPAQQSATYVARQGRTVAVLSGSKWRLEAGDDLSFGRAKGAEGFDFTHRFLDVQE